MPIADFSTIHEYQLPTEEARRMARELRERFPTLWLVRMEPSDPEYTPLRPFAVIDLEPYTLHRTLKVFPESLLNARGLAEAVDEKIRRLGGITPGRYWALKEAEKAMRDAKRRDEAEEKRDILLTALRSPLHRFEYHDGERDDRILLRK